ncbi:hypothetical protein ACHHYP_00366 [Achlya hypogyna]|uniref:Uncharacterized protein n=1 Tax=Achlya hypogyna TaxID=1202772 RepID=A0A1V9ZB30_ACHHY|nr:hypothetical protein ACHHYP_00366 [Achlya hypogyna]
MQGGPRVKRRPVKKRDGRRADGLGLVPHWDAVAPTVLFPSIARNTESPRCLSSQRARPSPRTEPTAPDTAHFKRKLPQRPLTQGAASPRVRGISREDTTKYQFLPRKPVAMSSPPKTPRARNRADLWSMHETWAPSTVIPVDAVIETIASFAGAERSSRTETSQSGVLRLFLEDWLERFETEDINYRSIVVHAQVGFSEIQRLTSHVQLPNDVMTAYCCALLHRIAAYFGPYEGLLRLLSSEVQRAVYVLPSVATAPAKLFHETTYFTAVKQARTDLQLRADKRTRCQTRNQFLERELVRAQTTLETALHDWADELQKSCFFAWYEASVVRKKVLAKNLRWFSMWFSGSPRTLVASTFEDWRRFVLASTGRRIALKLQEDCDKVAVAQKYVTELTEDNAVLQNEHDQLREHNRLLLESIEALTTHSEHAKIFLRTTPAREESVCFDGQLRMEAVSELAHFVFESLLRFQYNVGFHQQRFFSPVSPDAVALEQLAAFALGKAADAPSLASMGDDDIAVFLGGLHRAFAARERHLLFCTMAPPSASPVELLYAMVGDLQRQQEHIAATSALFFARHFEDHETSISPPSLAAAKLRSPLGQSRAVLQDVAAAAAQSQLTQAQSIVPGTVRGGFGPQWRVLAVGRCFLEYAALLYHPCDMSPYVRNGHIAHRMRDFEYTRTAPITTDVAATDAADEGCQSLECRPTRTADADAHARVAAGAIIDGFATWKDVSLDLVVAGVVQAPPDAAGDAPEPAPSPEKRASKSKGSMSALGSLPSARLPRRLPPADHCQPEPSGIYATGAAAASKKFGDYAAAKLHAVDQCKVTQLNTDVRALRWTLEETHARSAEVVAARVAVCHVRRSMWQHGCALVAEKESQPFLGRRAKSDSAVDTRPSLHTAVSWEVPAVAALVNEEADPAAEMSLVRALFERHDASLRKLYGRPGDGGFAVAADELSRALKRLRIRTKVLSASKDDVVQQIPVADLAELLLRICNEQFRELPCLSCRVESFVSEHLRYVNEAPSPLREVATSAAVKAVLADCKESLIAVFKAYAVKPKGRDRGVGRAHLTLREWSLFIKDYQLSTPQFTMESARQLFVDAQDGDPNEDAMEMLFVEFSEAIVGLAGFMLPDPFIDWAVKTALFVKRFLVDRTGK